MTVGCSAGIDSCLMKYRCLHPCAENVGKASSLHESCTKQSFPKVCDPSGHLAFCFIAALGSSP